jgi:hypothetical protein
VPTHLLEGPREAACQAVKHCSRRQQQQGCGVQHCQHHRRAVVLQAAQQRFEQTAEREVQALRVETATVAALQAARATLASARQADTRRVLALGLSASLNAPIGEPKFGVFRM